MFVGIDLGTSSVKLILVDQLGKIVKTVSRSFEVNMEKASWSEQDPNQWYHQTFAALKEIIQGYEASLKGISFSGQMHGLTLLDEHDEVIRPAILWNDQRTTEEVEWLNHTFGIDRLMALTGNIAVTGLTLPKLLWVKKHEPNHFKRIKKVLLPKDYLVYKLTDQFVSEVSDASGTLWYDVEHRKYADDMIHITGLDKSCFPRVVESSESVGFLSESVKAYLKITQDVNVIAGAGDQAAGAVGLGVVNDGDVSISLGTSGVVFVSSDQFFPDEKSHLQSYAHANGKYHLMAVMLSAAGSVHWFRKIIKDISFEAMYNGIEKADSSEQLFFLPYLMGERAPINDPNARGVFLGLSAKHTIFDMGRALIEGVTFALKDSKCLIQELGINISEIKITGGGAQNDIWCQIVADTMNAKVIRTIANEGPALGAAILAMVGSGAYHSVNEACKQVIKIEKIFDPNADQVALYQEKYKQFRKIYPDVKSLF